MGSPYFGKLPYDAQRCMSCYQQCLHIDILESQAGNNCGPCNACVLLMKYKKLANKTKLHETRHESPACRLRHYCTAHLQLRTTLYKPLYNPSFHFIFHCLFHLILHYSRYTPNFGKPPFMTPSPDTWEAPWTVLCTMKPGRIMSWCKAYTTRP